MDRPTVDSLRGISEATKQKLRDAGFHYVEDILIFSPAKLAEMIGVSKETAEKILDIAVEAMYQVRKEQTLGEFIEEAGKKRFMSTGAYSLNRILRGGWCVGEVTEIAGEYASGKSQTIYTALAIAFLPPMDPEKIREILFGGEEKKRRKGEKVHYGLNEGDITVLLIDAERTFNWERFRRIVERFNLDKDHVKERFYIYRPRNSWELRAEIDRLHRFVKNNNTKLVVVDSLTKLPRADFSGVGQLYERQRLILEMAEKLRRIAQTYELVVLITNQVVAVPGALGLGYRPAGGHVLGHTVDTRLLLIRAGDLRKVRILDSSWLPPDECKIRITDGGIDDA